MNPARLSRRLQHLVPASFHSVLLRLYAFPMRVLYSGDTHFCPLCESHLRTFLPHGSPPRSCALCPVCFSLERHRFAWVFLKKHTNLFDGSKRRFLHFAPEPGLWIRLLRESHLSYVTADLENPRVKVHFDITTIPFADKSFDAVYCSHVLEHVTADKKAIKELWRVLEVGGWALIAVPITAKSTMEDPRVTDPSERLRLYGQADHVRRYGPDFLDRLEQSGFEVSALTATEVLGEREVRRLGLSDGDLLYYCLKSLKNANSPRIAG